MKTEDREKKTHIRISIQSLKDGRTRDHAPYFGDVKTKLPEGMAWAKILN